MAISMISVQGLSFYYGQRAVLQDLSFSVQKGQIVSLIGPNGSGKSTLLRCLSGQHAIKYGSVELAGKRLNTYSKKQTAQLLSFLPQFQELTSSILVRDLVAMGRAPYHTSGWVLNAEDKDCIEWVMAYMKIDGLKNRNVNELSGGERQRVWIAMILAQDTPVILLDEPASYMDLRYQRELLSLLHDLRENQGKTIISVFHDINHAVEISDAVCMLEAGTIHQFGSVQDVITETSIQSVYGVRTRVCCIASGEKPLVVPENIHLNPYSHGCSSRCRRQKAHVKARRSLAGIL